MFVTLFGVLLLPSPMGCVIKRPRLSDFLASFVLRSIIFAYLFYSWFCRCYCMNENLYIAHKKLPHKTLRVHSVRYTQCIHVSSRKLKLPKDTHTKRYKQLLLTHPFPKVELYIAVKCKNIYKVTNNDNRKKKEEESNARTHVGCCVDISTSNRKIRFTMIRNRPQVA